MSRTQDSSRKGETTTVKVDKQTRDRFRAFRDSVEDGSVGTYDDALRTLLEIAVEEGYWDGEDEAGDAGGNFATADEVAELREGQRELFEAMKQNKQAIQELQNAE